MNAELYPQDPLISETDRLALVPRPPDFYRTWIEGKQEDAEGTEGKKEEEKEKEERETKRLPRLGSAPTAV